MGTRASDGCAAGEPGDLDICRRADLLEVRGRGHFKESMPGDVGRKAFEDRADGRDCCFVAGEEDTLGEARPPLDASVRAGRGALGGPVVGADDGEGVPGLAAKAQFAAGPPWPESSKCMTKSMSISGYTASRRSERTV